MTIATRIVPSQPVGSGGGGGGGLAATIDIAYSGAQNRQTVIAASKVLSVGNFGGTVFPNILLDGTSLGAVWAPAAGFVPGAGDTMNFLFSSPKTLQFITWELSSSALWGTWILAVRPTGGVFIDMNIPVSLGGSLTTVLALDSDKQANVEEVRFTGAGGTVSGVPFVNYARFFTTG